MVWIPSSPLSVLRALGGRLLVLVLAVLLWSHVITDEDYELVVSLPLSLTGLSEEYVAASSLPQQVEVRVEGSGKALLRLRYLVDGHVEIRLRDVRVGRHTLEIAPAAVHTDPAVTVLEVVRPKALELEVDRMAQARLPARPDVKATVASGYTLVGVWHVDPESLTVRGPSRLVSQLTEVRLDSLRVEGATERVSAEMAVIAAEGVPLWFEPDRATVWVDVQAIGQHRVDGIPVQLRDFPEGLRLRAEPPVLNLRVAAGTRVLPDLKAENFAAYIDYDDYRRANSSTLPAQISAPPEVLWFEPEPKVFTLVEG